MDDPHYLVLIEAPPPAPMRIAYSTASDGTHFIPAFTDEAALLRFESKGGETASAPRSVLAAMSRDMGVPVVLDPGSPNQQLIGS